MEEDVDAAVLLFADASEFVGRLFKKHETFLLAAYQTKRLDRNIAKITVVRRINNEDARHAIELGSTFRVFRRKRVTGRQNA